MGRNVQMSEVLANLSKDLLNLSEISSNLSEDWPRLSEPIFQVSEHPGKLVRTTQFVVQTA
ncbi:MULTISPECIES: hypothetical protein [unclassified Sutcliffiella]|uniref:hypothetical protein n=1 Tax=unclassified Sutcliffiella TaxID=2837532 RepID=UPI0030CF487E